MELYVYDISGGIARSLSQTLLGQQIDGVWHTSVVVRGVEHYFGGGINVAPAGTTPFGHPVQVIPLGQTFLEEDLIEGLLVELSDRYTPESYSLFNNNCNNFSDDLAQLLTGNGVPGHITGLPHTVLATPFGQLIQPMLAGLEAQMKNMRSQAFRPHGGEGIEPDGHAVVPVERPASPPTAPGPVADGGGGALEAEPPELVAMEKELESAVAEAAVVDMEERLEELDLKEGRATPRQQLGEEGSSRLATEVAVKREFDKIMAAGGVTDAKEAEAMAVEKVAAAEIARKAATGGAGASGAKGSWPGSPKQHS